MQLSVTFKNLDPSDALKSYVQKKLDRFDKLLDNPAEATVVFSVEKIRHTAEISLSGDRLNLHAKDASESMYSSIDTVVDKLKKQIKKSKDKIVTRRANKGGIKASNTLISNELTSDDENSDMTMYDNAEYLDVTDESYTDSNTF